MTVDLSLTDRAIIIVALRELAARYEGEILTAKTVREEQMNNSRLKHLKNTLSIFETQG